MKAFEPFRIGKLELKNRLVVSAMVTNYCNPDGTPTEKYLAYHEHKAQGGWGLIITEDCAIAPKAGGFTRLPGLWEGSQIQPHQELTRRVHQAGGKIVAQIYHAGRETSSAITGERPVGPSPIREPSMPETPRELTVEKIHQLVEQFGDCARRAQQAGFDEVEVRGAHGYLVGAFASPFANKRCDEYGGTIQNRARFAVEIIRNIKQKCGADFPVLYRMSVVEYVPGGLEIEEAKVLARLVEEAGADCIHCSQGVYASTQHIIPPSVVARGAYVQNAAAIKSAVHIPVITEHAFVCQQGKAHGGQLSIAREEDIPGLRRLADVLHNNGVKAVAQISHAGGAANPQDTGMEPVSASAVQSPRAKAGAPLPRAMTVGEIQAVVEAFAQAACRAQEAGFDGVELHAAHGYLLNQFYSTLTNHRTDAYTGATLAGRLRFLLEAVEAVRAAVGQEFLLAVRLGTGDDMPGGTTVEDSVRACQLLEQAGVDLLDISGGFCGPYWGGSKEQGYFSDWSQAVKEAVSVPVLVTGGITQPEAARRLLEAGKADLVGVGRALLKDSLWAKRVVSIEAASV